MAKTRLNTEDVLKSIVGKNTVNEAVTSQSVKDEQQLPLAVKKETEREKSIEKLILYLPTLLANGSCKKS